MRSGLRCSECMHKSEQSMNSMLHAYNSKSTPKCAKVAIVSDSLQPSPLTKAMAEGISDDL